MVETDHIEEETVNGVGEGVVPKVRKRRAVLPVELPESWTTLLYQLVK